MTALYALALILAGLLVWRYCFRNDGADAALAFRIRCDEVRGEAHADLPEPTGRARRSVIEGPGITSYREFQR